MPGDDDVDSTDEEPAVPGSSDTDPVPGSSDADPVPGSSDTDPAELELRSLEASFAAVEEAMESLTRITADGGDGAVVVAQIEAVVNSTRFPLEADPTL
ncbi:MAG: hypothetical protein ACOYOQ_07065 [Microthrixaceae bacterium]